MKSVRPRAVGEQAAACYKQGLSQICPSLSSPLGPARPVDLSTESVSSTQSSFSLQEPGISFGGETQQCIFKVMLEVQVQLQRAELGCVTRAEFVPVVDVNGLFLFSSHFPPSFSLYSFASHLFEVPGASGQVEVCLEAGETLFLCRNHSCWVCLPCCWGDLPFLRSILFWKQLVPLGKH